MQLQKRLPLFGSVVATLLLQLWLCHFFSIGDIIPLTNDATPANYRCLRFLFPPQGFVSYDYWLGFANQSVPLTPASLLAHLPVWWFFTLFYPLCGALAVGTGYWLLRELKLARPAAVIGGLIYGWQGPLLSNIYSGHFGPMALLVLMPLAVGAALRAIRNRSWRAAIVGGALLGMNICLQPDHGMLVALLVGALYLTGIGRGLRHARRESLLLGGRLLAVIGMAALVALPTIQTMFQTQISGVKQGASADPQEHWDWATQWSLPVAETLDYLAPGFFGWRSGDPAGPYWGRIGRQAGWEQQHQGFRNFSISATSFGTVALVLALAGAWLLWRKHNPAGRAQKGAPTEELLAADQVFYGRFFAIALVICYLLALGRYAPFYWLFYKLPYMDTWRNPLKFMVPGGLCLTVLAACGTQALTTNFFAVAQRRLLTGVSVVTGLVLLAAWGATSWLPQALTPQGYSPAEIAAAMAGTRLTALVAAVVVGLLWIVRARPAWGTPLLTALVVGQMWWVHSHYLESFNFRAAYQTNPLIETIRTDPEPVRVKFLAQDGLLHYYLSAVFPYHRIASLDIPATSRMPDDYQAFFTALQNNPLRLWQLAGVKYLALPASLLNQVLLAAEVRTNIAGVALFQAHGTKLDDLSVRAVAAAPQATHALVVLKDFLPKATFVPGVEVLPDQETVGRRLAAPAWNPRHTLLLDQAVPASGAGDATGTVHLRHYSGRRIETEIEATAPGYLLINDRYDANWHATVNGQPVSVVRADLILYAVPVPAGRSAVVLRYQSPATAIYIHLAALAAIILIVVITLATRSRSG